MPLEALGVTPAQHQLQPPGRTWEAQGWGHRHQMFAKEAGGLQNPLPATCAPLHATVCSTSGPGPSVSDPAARAGPSSTLHPSPPADSLLLSHILQPCTLL